MKIFTVFFLLTTAFFTACTPQQEPLNYGHDVCEHCKMMIMDSKYGAEIVSAKGKIFKFDATECMIEFLNANAAKFHDSGDQFLTTNVAAPGTLMDARTAFFLKDKAFQSPMGANLAAFSSRQLAENNHENADGKILTWNELVKAR